ncbi:DUF6233 domain-containing protein [Streptomyces sp. NPDC087859]|uniref:DUF6233 domain-containing protein n=1 Tax=Streptomyces sp. NPDC087859 TaxID=3365812 RepID=UPI0038103402
MGRGICSRLHFVQPVWNGVSRAEVSRTCREAAQRDLARTRRWIVDEGRREAERRRGVEAGPPVPDWLIEQGVGHHGPPVYVHAGGCHMAGERSKGAAREQAVHWLPGSSWSTLTDTSSFIAAQRSRRVVNQPTVKGN